MKKELKGFLVLFTLLEDRCWARSRSRIVTLKKSLDKAFTKFSTNIHPRSR